MSVDYHIIKGYAPTDYQLNENPMIWTDEIDISTFLNNSVWDDIPAAYEGAWKRIGTYDEKNGGSIGVPSPAPYPGTENNLFTIARNGLCLKVENQTEHPNLLIKVEGADDDSGSVLRIYLINYDENTGFWNVAGTPIVNLNLSTINRLIGLSLGIEGNAITSIRLIRYLWANNGIGVYVTDYIEIPEINYILTELVNYIEEEGTGIYVDVQGDFETFNFTNEGELFGVNPFHSDYINQITLVDEIKSYALPFRGQEHFISTRAELLKAMSEELPYLGTSFVRFGGTEDTPFSYYQNTVIFSNGLKIKYFQDDDFGHENPDEFLSEHYIIYEDNIPKWSTENCAYIRVIHADGTSDNSDIYPLYNYGVYATGLFIAVRPYTEATARGDQIGDFCFIQMIYNYDVQDGPQYWVINLGEVMPPETVKEITTGLKPKETKPESGGTYEDDTSTEGGGGGASGTDGIYTDTSDPIDLPNLPSVSAIGTGFVRLYNPSMSQIQALATEMNTDSFFESIPKLWQTNPLECILSLHFVPCPVTTAAASEEIIFGNYHSGVSMLKITEQYVTVDCGTVEIEKWTGSATDYSPHTKIQIYLPFIGFRQLNTDSVMGKTVSLTYNFDVLTGSCVASLSDGTSVLYSWQGSALMQLPITTQNFTSAVLTTASYLVSVGATVGSIISGNAALIAGSVAGLASASANAVSGFKPDIINGGSIGQTGGFLSVRTPYLIIERPKQSLPKDYANFNGFPSNITLAVGECKGYTAYEVIDVDQIPALQEEKDEIESILKGGFYA